MPLFQQQQKNPRPYTGHPNIPSLISLPTLPSPIHSKSNIKGLEKCFDSITDNTGDPHSMGIGKC